MGFAPQLLRAEECHVKPDALSACFLGVMVRTTSRYVCSFGLVRVWNQFWGSQVAPLDPAQCKGTKPRSPAMLTAVQPAGSNRAAEFKGRRSRRRRLPR